jgi:hypothetical protein
MRNDPVTALTLLFGAMAATAFLAGWAAQAALGAF